jgi:hypothetical protein
MRVSQEKKTGQHSRAGRRPESRKQPEKKPSSFSYIPTVEGTARVELLALPRNLQHEANFPPLNFKQFSLSRKCAMLAHELGVRINSRAGLSESEAHVLHVWLIPALAVLVLVLVGFYLLVRSQGGAGVRTSGRTLMDRPDDSDSPPPP